LKTLIEPAFIEDYESALRVFVNAIAVKQITTVADFFKDAGYWIACIAQVIDDPITLLRWARMPRLLPVGSDRLRVKFDSRSNTATPPGTKCLSSAPSGLPDSST
jgi:hypothetical protein